MDSYAKIKRDFEFLRLSQVPPIFLLYRAAKKVASYFIAILLLPVALLLHIAGYRCVTFFVDRIGHLALEPDCLLKEQALGIIPARKWIMLAPERRVSNSHLLSYWKPFFHVIHNRYACFLLESVSRLGLMRYDVARYARVLDKAQDSFKVYAQWSDRRPLLTLTEEDISWGKEKLEELGLPKEVWFACVHAREGGFSPEDEQLHSHRNSDIEYLGLAIKEIVKRGGWVVRIGDASMKPIPSQPNVIDYAHHPLKSERLDIILCAQARFVLGSTSGICLVASTFGAPVAVANMVPIADRWYGLNDISIPKRIWSKEDKKHLPFKDTLSYPLCCFRYHKQYIDRGMELVENTPEDIKALAIEMLDRLDGQYTEHEEGADFSSRFPLDERCASYYSKARLGTSFLEKYNNQDLHVSKPTERNDMTINIESIQDLFATRRGEGLQEAVYYCCGSAVEGDLVEFGTMTGFTARAIGAAMLAVERQYALPQRHLHLYDSFVGLPEPESSPDTDSPHVKLGHWAAGGCMVLNKEQLHEAMVEVLDVDRFNIVEGWYAESVPKIAEDQLFGFLHVDCDLYQSTIDCLDPLFSRGQISKGAVICFDDWNCNRAGNEFGERRAFIELTEKYNIVSEQWGSYTWSGGRFIIHGYDGCR